MFRRLFPYLLPMVTTIAFMASVSAGYYWVGPLLIPFISAFHKIMGRFTPRQIVEEFILFETSLAKGFLLINGFFFLGFQVWIGWQLSTHSFQVWELVLFLYSVVVLNANFSTSLTHELMHIRSMLAKLISNILLLINGFFYLRADHLFIHHAHMGTSLDPASAPLGIGLWQYFARSIPGRIRILFATNKNSKYQLPLRFRWLTYGNLLVLIIMLVLALLYAMPIFWWLLVQFTFVPFLYEIVTYVQHYGLSRESHTGIDRIAARHSWNCFYKLSAYMHFMMPVHSLHHIHGQATSIQNIGPSLPRPFQSMVLLAMWPKKWRSIMDARVATALNTPTPCE